MQTCICMAPLSAMSSSVTELDHQAKGSYFLALDKNNNQKIDNRMELFGSQSGDGSAGTVQQLDLRA